MKKTRKVVGDLIIKDASIEEQINTLAFIVIVSICVYRLNLPSWQEMWSHSIVGTILAAVLLLTFFIQHEIVHFLTAMVLGYGKSTELSATKISIEGKIKREHLIAIALSPLVVITVIYSILILLFSKFAILYVGVILLNFIGSRNDIIQAYKMFKSPKGSYVEGNEERQVIEIIAEN